MLDPLGFDLNGVRVKRSKPQDVGEAVSRPFRHLAVCPFTILVDTREQLPYSFDGMDVVVPVVVAGLKSGDYSIRGMEDQIACERKSMDDLFGSVTWGRDRFEREIQRLAELPGFAAVIIEATWPEIMAPLEYRPGWINQTDPKSVEGTIVAWAIRYPRVSWWPCGDRRGAELRTFSILRKFWKEANQR